MEWGHVDSGTHNSHHRGGGGDEGTLSVSPRNPNRNHLKHDKINICPGEFVECTKYTLVKYRSYSRVFMIVCVDPF